MTYKKYKKNVIEAALKLKGISNVQIAKEAGVSREMVSKVNQKKRNSEKVERAIHQRLQPQLEWISQINEMDISPSTRLQIAGAI